MARGWPIWGRLRLRLIRVALTTPFRFSLPTRRLAVTGKIKLALTAGKANPAPPVGPALGSKVRMLPCGRQPSGGARQAWGPGRQRSRTGPACIGHLCARGGQLGGAWKGGRGGGPCRCSAWPACISDEENPMRSLLMCTLPAATAQGVNIMAFCKEYNAQTAKMAGQVIPVEITVYEVRGRPLGCSGLVQGRGNKGSRHRRGGQAAGQQHYASFLNLRASSLRPLFFPSRRTAASPSSSRPPPRQFCSRRRQVRGCVEAVHTRALTLALAARALPAPGGATSLQGGSGGLA